MAATRLPARVAAIVIRGGAPPVLPRVPPLRHLAARSGRAPAKPALAARSLLIRETVRLDSPPRAPSPTLGGSEWASAGKAGTRDEIAARSRDRKTGNVL